MFRKIFKINFSKLSCAEKNIIQKLLAGLFILALGTALVGCNKYTKHHPTEGYFHTNGELFAINGYSPTRQSFIDILDVNGELVTRLAYENEDLEAKHGYFGQGSFYYVEHDSAARTSTIKACDLAFSNCASIFSMAGKINYPVEMEPGKLLFQHSPFKRDMYDNWGRFIDDPSVGTYLEYRFYTLDLETNDPAILDSQSFLSSGPVYYIDQKIYFSANLLNDSWDISSKAVKIRSDYTAEISHSGLLFSQTPALLADDYNIEAQFTAKNSTVYYLGLSNGNGYVYQVCVVPQQEEHSCHYAPTPTTNPAFVDDSIYYGVWNEALEKFEFRQISISSKAKADTGYINWGKRLQALLPFHSKTMTEPSYINWDKWSQKLPTYGHYGAPDYTGGDIGGRDFSKRGVNAFDEAFRLHDMAYFYSAQSSYHDNADRELFSKIDELRQSPHWDKLHPHDKFYMSYVLPSLNLVIEDRKAFSSQFEMYRNSHRQPPD